MTRKEKAMQSFLDGYNCSQCMILAFEDLLTIDLDTALKSPLLLVEVWDAYAKYVAVYPVCLWY